MSEVFKSGHTRYVECVHEYFRDGVRWLDAGGGRRIFPDLYDGERDLVARSRHVIVCDADLDSLRDHASVGNLVCCDLAKIPLPDNAVDFITNGMVVEHLPDPASAIKELGRVLDRGGILIIHTVNLWGYPTLLAMATKLLPFRKRMIAKITGRKEEDIFDALSVQYQSRDAEIFEQAGLEIKALRLVDASIQFKSILPLRILEKLWIRITRWPAPAQLRGNLIVIATKRATKPEQ